MLVRALVLAGLALADDVGGLAIGRPYASCEFSVSRSGVAACTAAGPDRLADVAVVPLKGGTPRRITDLSGDLLRHRELGKLEEFWVPSSFSRSTAGHSPPADPRSPRNCSSTPPPATWCST
jgi:hypothetical protein